MKISKRFLSAVSAAACVVTFCAGAVSLSVSAEKVTNDMLTFETAGDHVTVIDCDPEAKTVVIPSEIYNLPVTEIGSKAFDDCNNLTQVTIPDSVTTIGAMAFYSCDRLNSVSIPLSVTKVGVSAFSGTDLLAKQTGPVYYVSKWAVESDSATAVRIDNGTVGIADNTFVNCGLETVNIPGTVVTIGEQAFSGNKNIRTVTIPSGVKTIGAGAFAECSSLLSVDIAPTVSDIGMSAFIYCENLADIKIPSSVNHIGKNAFAYTSDYKNQKGPEIYIDTWVVNCLNSEENLAVKISKGTKGIADSAFENKEFVISATIPEGVTTIGSNAFGGCTALSQLTIPDSVKTIGSNAFSYTSIPGIILSKNIESIGYAAFSSCRNLENFTILNANCDINDDPNTIYQGAKMHVLEKSTAYDYAIKYGRKYDYEIPNTTPVAEKGSGDVDNSGALDLQDVIAVAKHLLNNPPLTEQQKLAADFNGDGKVDLQDAIAMAKALLKK